MQRSWIVWTASSWLPSSREVLVAENLRRMAFWADEGVKPPSRSTSVVLRRGTIPMSVRPVGRHTSMVLNWMSLLDIHNFKLSRSIVFRHPSGAEVPPKTYRWSLRIQPLALALATWRSGRVYQTFALGVYFSTFFTAMALPLRGDAFSPPNAKI